ncbi:MAG: choline ABC transporter ATP-binding protein [Alphaproteobacteria bacterium]
MSHIVFENVDIVFGDAQKNALAKLDQGGTRDEILKSTGSVIGVAGASLTVEEGEICVLMGLSGSGKSTLLRAVNGLNKVARGKVMLKHRGAMVDIAKIDADTLRAVRTESVAMVFQQFALLPWRTVKDNVGFGLELKGMGKTERDAIVDQKLKMVQLDPWAQKYAHELSGGMQQRVGLARAFATDASLLLMDEPFSALDPLIRTKLQDELLSLQKNLKKTILFVSHDLDEAMKIGNRIAIMEGGRIVQWGTPEDIILRPANEYVAEFVAHMNPLNVVRARSIMRPLANCAHEGTRYFIDDERKASITVDSSGRPHAAMIEGVEAPLLHIEADGVIPNNAKIGIAIASPDITLKSAIALRQTCGHGLGFVDGQGHLIGLCDDSDIFSGLLREKR